ncbi:MAG: hypothetical protein OHK005_13130 [Candidatus Methylacidiphilales bacterium]
MKRFGNLLILAAMVLLPRVGFAQPSDSVEKLLKVDPNKEIQIKEFHAPGRAPKMSPYDKVRTPQVNSQFQKNLPIKQAETISKRQASESLSNRRWTGGKDQGAVPMSPWQGRESTLARRASADAEAPVAPRMASGLSSRVQQPKTYLGPENPKARPESEVIRNTLGTVESVEELGQHRLSQAEIRRLLMTPERVRRAEAADRDPGITTDVAPRAIAIPKDR